RSGASRTDAGHPDAALRSDVLARAAELLDRMDAPELPSKQYHRLDAEFHVLLSSLSGNVVLETMMASLRQATIGYVQETVALIDDWGAVRDRLQAQHREILDAVAAGDGETAATALAEHITWFYGHSRALLEDDAD
ncbi:MAG: FCD domain-containing protein, partial [Micrococcus sp.]|nr:FCD domain-containing protein [Micrococcus sp.]